MTWVSSFALVVVGLLVLEHVCMSVGRWTRPTYERFEQTMIGLGLLSMFVVSILILGSLTVLVHRWMIK